MLHEEDPHECSVLISVHVIYSSTVLFTPEHGLHTVCCQASGATCRVVANVLIILPCVG